MTYQYQIDRAEATLGRIAGTLERTENLLAAVLDTLVAHRPEKMPKNMPTVQGAHYAAAFPLVSNPQDEVGGAMLTAMPLPPAPVTEGAPTPDVAVAAHFETVHLAFTTWVPAHGTRADDPNYHYFNEARDRLKAAGKLVCWRCGSTEDIQIHHDKCEWCSINGVDIARFAAHFPALFTGLTGDITDAEFARAIESEGGLLPLCQHCHTGKSAGIHYVPYPIWLQGAYERAGLPPPAQPVIVSAVVAATPDDNTKENPTDARG